MPLFSYTAYDPNGKKSSGLVEAGNLAEAKTKLREQKLMVSELSTQVKISRKENLDPATLTAITYQLAELVKAGIPLYQSLVTIEEQYKQEPFHRILLSLVDQVKSGNSLSDAMSAFPESFDTLYVSMVRAGENSGALGLVLTRLVHFLQKQEKLKKEIVTAMIYPAILALFSLIVVGLLLGFVVPSIEGIFAGRELNSFTQFVITTSEIFRGYWWIWGPALLFSALGLTWFLQSPLRRAKLIPFWMKIPPLRKTLVQAALARFTRTFSTLLQGGAPLVDALQLSASVTKNPEIEALIQDAAEKIIEGSSLSKELKKSPLLPPIVSRMISVGEETGSLPQILGSIADMYEEEVEKTLSRLTALAQPVILIVMGGVIGLIMTAILVPISSIISMTNE